MSRALPACAGHNVMYAGAFVLAVDACALIRSAVATIVAGEAADALTRPLMLHVLRVKLVRGIVVHVCGHPSRA